MRKSTFILLLVVSTLAALALAWFWALAPLTALMYIHPSNWTSADLVRDIWHFRLIPPEWGNTPIDYLDWCMRETCARLGVTFLAWCVMIKLIERRYLRTEAKTPLIVATPGRATSLG